MIHQATGSAAALAITTGFALGLTLVYGMDTVVDFVTGEGGDDGDDYASKDKKSRANSLEDRYGVLYESRPSFIGLVLTVDLSYFLTIITSTVVTDPLATRMRTGEAVGAAPCPALRER